MQINPLSHNSFRLDRSQIYLQPQVLCQRRLFAYYLSIQILIWSSNMVFFLRGSHHTRCAQWGDETVTVVTSFPRPSSTPARSCRGCSLLVEARVTLLFHFTQSEEHFRLNYEWKSYLIRLRYLRKQGGEYETI